MTESSKNKAEILEFRTAEAVDLQACAWVARLDCGDLEPSESADLQAWLKISPKHRELLAMYMDNWGDMELLRELSHVIDLSKDPTRPQRSWLSVPAARPLAYGLAAALLVVGVAQFGILDQSGFGFVQSSPTVAMSIDTAIGERITEQMPDGSIVHINTASRADIDFNNDERSIQLYDGEGYFEVAQDDGRPFVVYAAGTEVRAVGTSFSVKVENSRVEVAIVEGVVAFTAGSQTRSLSAGLGAGPNLSTDETDVEVMVYEGGKVLVEPQRLEVVARSLAWHEGMLEFRGESLEYVVQELSRYTTSRLVIVDEDIRGTRVGGYFKIGDIEGLAATLEMGFDVHVEFVSEDLIELSRASR